MGKTGRPKKTDSETLVRLVEDFYANEGHGDPASLQCTKLAKYAARSGVDAKDYDFRRDEKVKERIKQLKEKNQVSGKPVAAAYRNLDIEGLIRRCGDLSVLRRTLYELDSYWKGIYEASEATRQETLRLHKSRETMTKKLEEAKKQLETLQQEKISLERDNKRLSSENTFLRKQIRSCIYPALANELLAQANLPSAKSRALKPEAVSTMIEGPVPQPFDGFRGGFHHEMTRAEDLEAQMKAQVRNGK